MDWRKWFSFHDESENKNEETLNSKDIETRMVYQYPKNTSEIDHNDLIKIDKSKLARKRKRSPLRKEPVQPMSIDQVLQLNRSRRNNKQDSNLSSQQVERDNQQENIDRLKGIQENKHIRKTPFRPSEIPSPVFGFHKRNTRNEEKIEFELTPLETNIIKETFASKNMNENNVMNEMSPLNEERKEVPQIGEHRIHTTFEENQRNNDFEEGHLINEIHEEFYKISTNEIEDFEESSDMEEFEPECIEELSQTATQQLKQTEEIVEIALEESENILNVESDLVEEEIVTPKREYRPFNVVMLKTDWEAYYKRKKAEGNSNSKVDHISETKSPVKQDEPILENQTSLNSANDALKANPEHSFKKEINESRSMSSKPLIDERVNNEYAFPSINLLNEPVHAIKNVDWLNQQANILNQTLVSFNVAAKVVDYQEGPSVTRFELQPEPGVKVNRITNLSDDLKLSLAAKDIRIEAPIPGKHTIGIEIPNQKPRPVNLREIIENPSFYDANSSLTVALGLDIAGKPIVTDLKKMPHGLIAGSTGSGKSVCINTIIVSLLYKADPRDVKLLLIDPKMVELAPYNGIPHLVSPVITDAKTATLALEWAVEEMERRYELFAHTGVRDIVKFNLKGKEHGQHLPYIVIIIDELADLMMVAPGNVEEAICRIAQKARACGIHLIIATQRPSVDVITGLIKANIPTRIAFSVSSQVDSRTIIDISGAERLLGKGDMLFLENGTSKPIRLQGPFVSDEEIEEVVEHVKSQGEAQYLFVQDELVKKSEITGDDELLPEVCEFAVRQGVISTSSIQRHFRVGYNRAARIIEIMEDRGMISEARGSKPRDVLLSESELREMLEYI